MGTRGLYGFVIDGDVKVTYNHSDSYPSGLGASMLKFARSVADSEDARKAVTGRARGLRLVSENDQPSAEDIERLAPLADLSVGSRQVNDWYVLLRGAQGRPDVNLSAGVMIDGREFAADSLFCEWGYVIDLDARAFEVYQGFQTDRHQDGRFAEMRQAGRDTGYAPIRLVARFPLDALPESLDEDALTTLKDA